MTIASLRPLLKYALPIAVSLLAGDKALDMTGFMEPQESASIIGVGDLSPELINILSDHQERIHRLENLPSHKH